MSPSPLYIHLEGMDLAGKTTARIALTQSLGSSTRVRHNSICDANPIYEMADKLRKANAYGSETLGYLYVAALAADIERFAPPTMHTVQDSTIVLRSLAYHSVVGTPFVVDAMLALLHRHPRFSKSFVLTASLEVRRSRLEERQREQPTEIAADDLQMLYNPDHFLRMEATLIELAQRHFDAIVIDTSDLEPIGVVDAIVRELPATNY